jgi:hypothetical protein
MRLILERKQTSCLKHPYSSAAAMLVDDSRSLPVPTITDTDEVLTKSEGRPWAVRAVGSVGYRREMR